MTDIVFISENKNINARTLIAEILELPHYKPTNFEVFFKNESIKDNIIERYKDLELIEQLCLLGNIFSYSFYDKYTFRKNENVAWDLEIDKSEDLDINEVSEKLLKGIDYKVLEI